MDINDTITINGIMVMTGGAGKNVQFSPKTTAEAVALVGAWTTNEAGRIWFNTDTKQLEMWDGVNRVLLG